MMKRIISILCIAAVLFSYGMVYAESESELNSGVVEKLTALGVIGGYDSDFTSNEEVTRADFAVMISRLMGVTSTFAAGETDTTTFSDVSQDYWAAYEISYVSHKKLLEGYADGKFYPDETVSYYDVVKTFVTLLGYDQMANMYGGYPDGYIAMGGELGITEGVQYTKKVTRKSVLSILNNALDVKIAEINIDNDKIIYEESDDKTILSQYRDIYMRKGILSANSVTSLTSGSEMLPKEGHVIINGEELYEGETDAASFLGMNVEYYYKDDVSSGEKTILFISGIESKNNVIEISGEHIILADGDETKNIYEYYDDKFNFKKARLSDELKVFYNGVAKPDYSYSQIRPKEGSVKLIDNNNDGIYEVLSVFETTIVCVADGIGEDDDAFYIKNKCDKTNLVELPKKNESNYFTIIKNKKNADISAIKSGVVLNIGINPDYGYALVYVSDVTIDGNIVSVSDEDVTIGEKEYAISDYYLKVIEKGASARPTVGKRGKFYIDYFGYLQYFEAEAETVAYGILINTYKTDDDECLIKIFDQDGNIVKYKLADKVKLSSKDNVMGKKITDQEAVEKMRETNTADGARTNNSGPDSVEKQLIRYSIQNDVINTIDLVAKNAGDKYEPNIPLTYAGKSVGTNGGFEWYEFTLQWGPKMMSINNKYYATSDTYFFDVYEDENDMVVKKGEMPKSAANYTLYLYNMNEDQTVSVILRIFRGANEEHIIQENSQPFFVEKVGEECDETGEIKNCIYGFENGKKTKLLFAENETKGFIMDVVRDLKRGDIILYNFSNSGILNGIRVICSAEKSDVFGVGGMSKLINGLTNFAHQEGMKYVYCMSEKKVGKILLYNLGPSDKNGSLAMNCGDLYENKPVYKLSFKKSGKLSVDDTLTLDDIKPGEKLFIVYKYTGISSIWIIE